MLQNAKANASFSVNDLEEAKRFYGEMLGIEIEELPDMGIRLHLKGNEPVFVYPKDTHEPATFTILNFEVDDIDGTVLELNALGVICEQYEYMETDKHGISRQGTHSMAWFKDPAGNILSVIQPGTTK
jgi:predicted enzyme related to lactoylglutathione lyase